MLDYPKLKFNIDKTFDYWTGNEFLTFEKGDGFSERIIDMHPEPKSIKGLEKGARKERIENYVDSYYKENIDDIENSRKVAESNWNSIEGRFYKVTDKYFKYKNKPEKSYPWPKYDYNAFMSIFNCNPRFIEDKEFQLFYKGEEFYVQICVHEMLHFMFYDYFENEFPKLYKQRSKQEVWKFSEVLNDVILRESDYISITKVQEPGIYAQTEDELRSNIKLWNETGSIERFIIEYFNKL